MVVLTSACPSNSCTVRISHPSSSRWVAKEWRTLCGAAGFVISALSLASLNAFWRTDTWRWCRRFSPVARSTKWLVAENTHCQPHSLPALGYFRSRAFGKLTRPQASFQIFFVLPLHCLQVSEERCFHHGGKHSVSVFVSLTARTTPSIKPIFRCSTA